MRFDAEKNDPENRGLEKARARLEPLKQKYDWISYADLYTLAGYVGIEASGGPYIPFGVGRKDYTKEEAATKYGSGLCPFGDGKHNPLGSRLPAADLGTDKSARSGCPMHVKEKPTIDAMRGVFTRLGMTDKETVCLIILGHQLGRCHLETSGFEHPWYAFDPAHWNAYESGLGYPSVYQFAVARDEYEIRVTSKGKRQYELTLFSAEPFMMLPVDMCLWWDEAYRQHVIHYDNNRRIFKQDSAVVWNKLTELGCDRDGGSLTQEAPPAKPDVRDSFKNMTQGRRMR
jgi:cytochrome c peroxidase